MRAYRSVAGYSNAWWGASGVQAGCKRGAGRVQAGCRRGAGGAQAGYRRGASGVQAHLAAVEYPQRRHYRVVYAVGCVVVEARLEQ